MTEVYTYTDLAVYCGAEGFAKLLLYPHMRNKPEDHTLIRCVDGGCFWLHMTEDNRAKLPTPESAKSHNPNDGIYAQASVS